MDNFTTDPIPDTVMIDRCATCAMRPGTEANRSDRTQAVLQLCILSGHPFECHDAGSGHLCKGFVEAFTVKVNNGYYDSLPEWRNRLYRKLLDAIDDYDAAKDGPADEFLRKLVTVGGGA